MICPKCGRNNMKGVAFCPYCGISLKADNNENVSENQLQNKDAYQLSVDMPPAESENANGTVQQSVCDPSNQKMGIRKEHFTAGIILLLMSIVLVVIFVNFVQKMKQNTIADNGSAYAENDISEFKHEDVSEKTFSESYAENSLYGEMQGVQAQNQLEQAIPKQEQAEQAIPEQNQPEQGVQMQNQSEQDVTELNQPETGGKEVIEIYGGIEAPTEDFIFPYSSQTILTDEDLLTLESDDLEMMHDKSQLAINEMFARYGYTFGLTTKTSSAAKERFEVLDWYKQVQAKCPSNSWWTLQTEYFNDIEVQNFQLLNEWQKQHGVYY